jgi:hypothetical protein
MGTASETWRDDAQFIGREEELAAIRQALEAVGRGRGRLVIVEGGPGSGRTRLVQEAAAEGRRLGLRVVWLPDHTDRGSAVLEAVIDDAGQGRPVVVVDDAPDRDRSDRLSALAGTVGRLPVVAIVTAGGSAGSAIGASWTSGLDSHVTRVRVRPLRPGAVMGWAAQRGIMVGIPALERVHVVTGGIALFVVETLAAIAERGAPIDGEPWPLSDRAVRWMQALLDGLPPVARAAVEAASVVGTAGTVALVEAVIRGEVDPAAVRSALAESAFTRVPPAGEHWRFVPPLARDLTYASLSAERRAVLHASVAAALAAAGSSPAILLAHRTLAAAAAGDARRCEHHLFRLIENHARQDHPVDASSWPYFVRDGEHWAIGFGTRAIRLNHRAGLLYLARLLSRPGVEFAALALGESPRARNVIAIDAQESPIDAERARVRVTRRVRDGIERIAQAHPELGAHLERTIRTGARCAYVVDPDTEPRWMVQWGA